MSNIKQYKPPLLAILEQNKKLRDYTPEERLTISKKLVVDLLGDLGVSAKADTNHHIRAIKYIHESCINYAPEEIEKAFALAINGEIRIDLYQQINALVIGKVMREFEFYKKERLKTHRRKMQERQQQQEVEQPTDQEKENIMIEAVDRLQKEYQQHKRIISACIHVYDHLFKTHKLPKHTDEFRDRIHKKAVIVAQNEYMVSIDNYEDHKIVKRALAEIEKGTSDKIIPVAKRIILEEYFKSL